MEEKQVQTQDLDAKMDSFLEQATNPGATTEPEAKEPEQEDKAEGDTPAVESKDTETPNADVEAKLAKIKEILGDDEEATMAWIKKQGFHKHPAWQKLLEKSKTPKEAPEVSREINEVKEIVSDPEFIRFRMQKQGYKDEAIDNYLRDKGFKIPMRQEDDVALVARSLNMKPEDINQEYRPIVADVAKIADIIFKDRMEKYLPEKMGPMSEKIDTVYNETVASRILNDMASKVKKDGDLSFEEDITPRLDEYMQSNPKATMNDINQYFKEIYPEMRIERIKLGKRSEKRGEAKKTVATGGKVPIASGKAPEKTGDFDKDADALFDFLGYKE